MKKVLLTLLALICSVTINVRADIFTLAGHSIMGDANLPDLATTLDALDDVTASGTISFNAVTNTLTLENATIECANYFDVLMVTTALDLTIELIGNNTFSQSQTTSGTYFCAIRLNDDNANLTITGSGKLVLKSYKSYPVQIQRGSLIVENTTIETYSENPDNYYGIGNNNLGGNLTINNSVVKTKQISYLNSITLTDAQILQPGNYYFSIGDYTVGAGKAILNSKNSSPAYDIVIFPSSFVVDDVRYILYNVSNGARQLYVPQQAWTNASLVIPDSVTYRDVKLQVHHIFTAAFNGNTNITSVDLQCERIWADAFGGCSNLETVTLREGVQVIAEGAFSYIKATSIHLPASINSLDGNSGTPFRNNKFTEITIADGNTSYIVGDDGAIYNKAKTTLVAYPYNWAGGKFSTIPETVTTILNNAFRSCKNLADTLVLPENLSTASTAFQGTNVKCVIVNSKFVANVFQGTEAVEEVIFGKTVQTIGQLMFSGANIKKITVLSETMPNWQYGTDYSYASLKGDMFTNATVYVPCGQKATYQADANKWANFANIEEQLMYDVEVIAPNAAFSISNTGECNQVTISVDPNDGFEFVDWDNGVTTPSFDCTVTSDTVITANIKKNLAVGDLFRANTTEGVSVLYKVLTKEPGNMTVQVGELNGFHGANYGQAIDKSYNGPLTISETVNYFDETYTVVALGSGAFSLCNITSLTLPNTVQKFDQNSIYECTKLKSVNIPEGITTIPRYNLSYMSALESITLPNSLEYICSGVFNSNTKLATIENWKPSQYKRVGNNIGAMNTKFFSDIAVGEDKLVYTGDILLRQNVSANLDTLVIKEGTRIICGDLRGDETLTTIVLPASLEAIGDMSFNAMPNLTSCIIKAAEPVEVYWGRDTDDPTMTKTAANLKFSSSSTPEISTIKFYVPKASVSAYKESATWAGMDIRPIGGWTATFLDGNGNPVDVQQVEQGETPVAPTTGIEKDPTTEQVFAWTGEWDKALAAVTEDVTYTATFNASPRPYTITFKNYDGTELWHGEFGYGLPITYGGTTPERPADAQYTYAFEAWDNGFVDGATTVTGEMTFTATYSTTTKKYTVKFYPDAVEAGDESGNFYINKKVNYGTSLATLAAEAMADPTFVIPECYRLLGWTVDGINLYASDIVIEKVILFPLWDTDATFTVRFVNKLGGATIDYFDDVECHQEATAPDSPTPGYKWQWDSDEWKSVTKDLVIEGLLVEEGGTAIGNISGNGENAVKVLIDGHLFIRCGDKVYSADGQELK